MTILWIVILIFSFLLMEINAWFTHKYIMHGFLWNLHRDHHVVNKDNIFQKNDYFFLIFALPSILLIFNGYEDLTFQFFIGFGIALYGTKTLFSFANSANRAPLLA